MSISGTGEGARLRAGGNDIIVKIGPNDGARDLSMFESVVPAGGQVFPHLHRDYEEAFYLLEGELTFLLDPNWHRARAGSAVHVARGIVHAFRNESKSQARVLVLHTPAAAIGMIEELAALAAGADPSATAAILARHASEPARVEQVRTPTG